MNDELDKKLCEKFPKLFRDRHAPITQSCLAFGLEVDDGWYNIIHTLCSHIQDHIDSKRSNRAHALQYNRCLKRALNGDKAGLIWFYTYGDNGPSQYTLKSVERDIAAAEYREVDDVVPQVVVEQVKEKFGSLRFYYRGGNDVIDGMVRMAEGISSVTCEECGAPGSTRGGRWLTTKCDLHAKT